ncbi:D-alanyl-D-alanine carboxypeptidase/D-alanyl-D-alanine endopeptidase [Nocardioides sambongensis]|uniref:D-alanyl-D-alanine carboxypeptidase/D-alanyl-D-alanine endopeptidase n=1 Tax=Nocardioides sambongensis TaxID=2589074 RepID=UPI00112C2B24|nr:D-alanyl-D-alanine carboxypeptidase/D-alanyl-D-alanine-endopeptidase [Nocardioides sambongensis]
MADRRQKHEGSPLRRVLATLVVIALVAGGVTAWRTGWAEEQWDSWRGEDTTAQTDPAAVEPPPEVDAPAVVEPAAVAAPADGAAALRATAIDRAITSHLDDKDLGRHVLAAVAPLETDDWAFERIEGADLAIPASTTKVVTSTAALFLLGADHEFSTTAVVSAGAKQPVLTLIGGGDPYLLAAQPAETSPTSTFVPPKADLTTLATRTARALKRDGTTTVRVTYDDTLFTGPSVNPTWEADYIPDGVVSPITSLWVDEGRDPSGYGRVADPSATAASAFAQALRDQGIGVNGTPSRASAPDRARQVAEVRSAPLAQIVQRLLEVSDNEATEVLLRHVGIAQTGDGSFTGGQDGVKAVLRANGVDMAGSVLYDGSGLSRQNRMSPRLLVDVLRLAADDDQTELWPVLSSLPVAGFTGSLTDRMDLGDPDGLGRVRAKTGTLTGVTSLAGIAVDRDGDLMAFALMADRIPKDKDLLARVAMDNAAAALGACRCAR